MKLKVFLLILANLAAAMIVLFFLDVFGIYNGYGKMNAFLGKTFSKSKGIGRSEDISLIEREEQNKLVESFSIREADLKKTEADLKAREDNLLKDAAALKQEKENLEKQKKKIQSDKAEKVAYEKKVQDLSERFYNMPPEKSVERILALGDDLLVLDTLKAMDAIAASKSQTSVVPYLYSLMPPADAARLLRLSTVSE